MSKPVIVNPGQAPLRSMDEQTLDATAESFFPKLEPFATSIQSAIDWMDLTFDATDQAREQAETARDRAQEWSNKTGATVDGTEYSAKEYASGNTVPTGSAKKWAEYSQTAAEASAASSNLKGRWIDLEGPLNMPASVEHNGIIWALLNDLENVALSEPGVSGDWVIAAPPNTKGTLTQSFIEGQQETIPLSVSTDGAAVVSVTKEVPQTGVTTGQWDVQVNGTNYDVENSAYATTLTPSATTGSIILTLGSGAFTSTDVGKTISGNGGVAVLTATDGSALVSQAFNNASVIASDEWVMKGVVFDGGSIEVSNFSSYFILSGNLSQTLSIPFGGAASGFSFNNDGTKFYIIEGFSTLVEFSMAQAYDINSSSETGLTFDLTLNGEGVGANDIAFSGDGSKLFVVNYSTDAVFEYTLDAPFDISSPSLSASFGLSSEESIPQSISFNILGDKMFIVGASSPARVFQYDLPSPFNLQGAEYSGLNYNVSAQESSPTGLAFDDTGSKFFIVGISSDRVCEYTLGSNFDLSNVTYSNQFSVSAQDSSPRGLGFSRNGNSMFITGDGGNNIYKYDLPNIGTASSPTTQHLPAITNTLGQIDSTFWTDINSALALETSSGQTINYAFSTDGRMTFTIVKANEGARNIVRDNSGTWEINTSATYAGEAWSAAAENSVWGALSEAMDTAANAMDATALAAATDADYPALGNELDLAIILYTDDATQIPSSQGVTLNYDANVLNQGAINGTDYEWDQPNNTTVRIKALQPNNLKVRVV